MKSVCGSLFAVAAGCALAVQFPAVASAQTETVLYSFGATPDGASPFYAGLIDVRGTLYGTTGSGGANDSGAVFAINPTTDAEKVVYSFCSKQNCTDGSAPTANLINVKGTFFGTTLTGGTYGGGTVFSVNPTTGAEKVFHSFGNGTDGYYPGASLIDVKGKLYGITTYGGTHSSGTVFSVDPATGVEKVLYSFCSQKNCTDGEYPTASLIDVNGTMYATTVEGGTTSNGTVFALDAKTGAETVIYNFCIQHNCADGAYPYASLIDVAGTLYSTTYRGGIYMNCNFGQGVEGCGTVFSINPTTGAEKVLHSFGNGTDGSIPFASLIDVKGTLYSTTAGGGSYTTGCQYSRCGTVFSVNLKTGAEKVLHSFQDNGTDGEYPTASLIDVKGTLYSTTYNGGSNVDCPQEYAYGCGTVFEITP